jgi:hypothetical protein
MESDSVPLEALSALLSSDLKDLKVFVADLSQRLAALLPERARLLRRGLWGGVKGVLLELGEWEYRLEDDGALKATRGHRVGGVVLRTEELSLEAWLEAVRQALIQEG